jgi:hypothetical protein
LTAVRRATRADDGAFGVDERLLRVVDRHRM